jgi:signal transduction histidine kinase
VGVDVTARKQAEREAARTERLAAMGGLAAALAHEINSPLQAIRSNLELTTGFELPEDERIERLNVVRREVERLIDVSRSTLDLARPDQETRSPVSVEALVKRSVDVMQEELRRAGVVVTSEYPEPVPRVLVAPARIMQVLVNVLVNAVEAMPDGGRLHVTSGVRAQTVALVFSNQGRPLSEEQTKRVFEPFYTTKQGGSGLGLFMSRAIVEWHGGRMSIQNLANGTGVALTVELPAAERARWKEGTA